MCTYAVYQLQRELQLQSLCSIYLFCAHRDKRRGRDKKGGKRDKKQDSPTNTTQDGATAENGDDDFLDDPPVQVRAQFITKYGRA